MKKIRLGLIGCGNMMGHHMGGVKLVDGLEVTAICDINTENMAKVAEVLDNPFQTTDYREMVDYVDAVLIALPHYLHFSCGAFFAQHKKHILMEKPLCATEQECLTLIDICEEQGVVFMCAYPVPYIPILVKLKEYVDSGEFGKVFQMSIWTEQMVRPKEGMWPSWACDNRIGNGGQLFSHGCHYIDVLLRFLGKPVSGNHMGTRLGTEWLMHEGTSLAMIKFESGAIGYHGATWGARGTAFGSCYQIHTEKGMLELKDDEIRLYNSVVAHEPGIAENTAYKVLYKVEPPKPGQEKVTKHTNKEAEHFVDCINTGKRPMTDARRALQSLRIIWEMYNAEKNGFIADLRGLGLEDA